MKNDEKKSRLMRGSQRKRISLLVTAACLASLGLAVPALASEAQSGEQELAMSGQEHEAPSAPSSDANHELEQAEVVFLSLESAREAFGVGDRNGTDSLNAFVTYADFETGLLWVPVFYDNVSLKDHVKKVGVEASETAKKDRDRYSIAARMSSYTQKQVEQALQELGDLITEQHLEGAFIFNPVNDTIGLEGTEETCEKSPKEINDVAISCSSFEDVGRAVFNNGTPLPSKGGTVAMGQPLGGSSSGYVPCTTGIPARNANGTRGIFTAGHCFRLTSHVFNNTNLNGGSNIGRVTHAYTFPSTDAQFISGKTYSGAVYAGSQVKPVIGTYFPTAGVGNRLCYMGSTTGYICNNSLQAYGAEYCDASGCSENLMRLSGGTRVNPGDSGGTVFANFGSNVRVSGIILGYIGSNSYVTSWTMIASKYGASLL